MTIAKRTITLFLLCGILLSMVPTAFAFETETEPVLVKAAQATVPTISQGEFENGTWNIDGLFRQIHPDLTKGGYWNSNKSGAYNKVITGESNSKNFFATPRFTRDDLPIGSVIVVEVGWKYRPEGWIKDALQTTREGEVTQMFIQVTEEWWGDYTLRGFNISRTDNSDLSELYQSDIYEAFRIYVPDEYIPLGYDRFYPKLEHCAYYDCVKNKIITRNSDTNAVYYFTTQKMTKSQLPVGSIVVMEDGWQNQPEAWLDDAPQASRPATTTQKVLEITDEWWGNYIRRSFTLSRTDKQSMENVTTEEIHDIFRIYIPKKTVSIEGLSDEDTNATTKIHQLPSKTPRDEGDYEKTMSYILQSREGKIIVIDGGYQTGNHDGKYLYAYLQRITGKAKPHVDAWFFTHPHPDHFAAFLTVANLYAGQITVDAVYHAFPSGELAEKYHYATSDPTAFGKYYDKLVTHTAKLKNSKGETTPLIEVNARHTGECNSTFDFDEIHIDILMTYEDAYWAVDNITTKYSGTLEQNGKSYSNKTLAQIASTNVNESCMIFRATFSGKSVLFLGDGSIVTEVMLIRYHEANAADSTKYFNLKSDIVQVSHHGVQSMGKAIYGLINPNEALWCTPYHLYASRPGDYHTTYYIRQWFRTTYATTNYVTYDGVDVLSFPVVRSASPVSIPTELKPYVFNAEYYANRYPDLKEAYGTDEAKLYNHFINYGIEEGRCASPFFDVKFYMNNNSQNFQETMKGNYEKAFKDFISNYKSTSYMKLSVDFDPAYYVTKHSDLKGSTLFALLQHYAANGYVTGEQASQTYLSKEGHTYHTDYTVTDAKAPTCTATGLTQGAKCKCCGEIFIAQETIPALGHDYSIVGAQIDCETGTDIPNTAFFANFTGSSDRYNRNSLYSGRNYDLGTNWSYLSERYLTPTVDTETGTMTTGIYNNDYSHIWIQTGPSYNEGFNLNYQPASDHITRIRVKFDGLKVLTGQTTAKIQVVYFIGPDRFEGKGGSEIKYGLDAYTITADMVDAEGFVTISYPVKGIDSASHTTMTCLRFQFSNLENIDKANPGKIVLDYIYMGPASGNIISYICEDCGSNQTPDAVDPVGHSYESVVTAPTCTAQGYTTHICATCGSSYTDTYVSAIGHAPVYTTKDADAHVITCENCDHTTEEAHTYVDGLCICGQAEIKEPVQESKWKIGHTLNLASDISVNLVVSKSLLTGFDMDTVYILTEIDLYAENEKTGTKTVKLLPVEQGNYYYFTLTGLTAVNMNDRIRSVLYGTKDGQEYYSATDEYSIADYAYSQMNKTAGVPDKLKVLCAELLRYGAKAQIYKNYRVNDLADSKMTDTHKAYLSDMDAVVFGNTNQTLNDLANASIKWVGKSLNLDSKVCLKFIFSKGTYTGDIADLTLRVSYTDTYGGVKELILTGAELYNEKLGYYAFTLDTMLAAELRSVVCVQVYHGETPVSATLQYSADTYGNNKTGTLLDVCKALFAYSDSAKSYFAG